ncbi:hypothetical protein HDU84_005012 [Entophlyctis sp. JEL0112]|nr:hypothetical protein HDU84_005012 [Entophlyctis sp. JEL0112]
MTPSSEPRIRVEPVRVNADNYAYLVLTDPSAKPPLCAAVDPCEPDKVVATADALGWRISDVLTQTHHHLDHSGGNVDLVRRLSPQNIPVFGGDNRIPGLTNVLSHGQKLRLGAVDLTALSTKCHTSGSISYYLTLGGSHGVVLTGDTLFIGGCGRFFEGTAEEMHTSLNTILASLPDDTEVYCGHEYTLSNLKFAITVDPNNEDLKRKLEWSEKTQVTVPSTIGDEKRFNPFMRVNVPSVIKGSGVDKPDEDTEVLSVRVMAKLREMKNAFR